MKYCLAVFFVDGPRKRNVHGARLDAVLGIAAHGDPVFSQNSVEPLFTRHLAGRMEIEKTNLRYRLRPDVLIAVILRTSFQATAASHAT